MALRQLLALATLANILYTASGANQCYKCGYQQVIIDGHKQNPTSFPGYPECTDTATQQNNKVECTEDGDCCGSIKEFYKMTDTDTGESRELLVGLHDCESSLKDYANYNVLCSEHTDECVDVDRDHLPEGHNDTIERAKICFCSGELCNWHVPGLDTTAVPDTTQKGKQCYNCGHMVLPSGEEVAMEGVAFCGDFATPEDITTNCANGDDCCASLKEYFTTIDEDTGENSTTIIGRHGCESDLNHIGEQTVLCSDYTDSCMNIDRSSLPDHTHNNVTVSDIEICFCSGDRCNNDDPIPPEPTTTTTTGSPGGGASSLVSSIIVLLLAFFC